MLINAEGLFVGMPLRTALEQGLEATDNQVKKAVTNLKTGDSELVNWGDFEPGGYTGIMRHREYSDSIKEKLNAVESNELLVIILGKDGNNVFDKAMNEPSKNNRSIETELSSLIGSDILNQYSKVNQSFGFDRDAINVRVTNVRDIEHLEDVDLERYFCIVILESESIDYGDKFVESLTDTMASSSKVVPMVYSFSNSISSLINDMDEETSSSIAASWVYSTEELKPRKQVDYLLHTFNQLFVEYEYENTSSHVRAIMENDYLYRSKSNKEIEALLDSCKLTSAGHNYFKRFVGNVINCHKKASEKVLKLILPNEFSRELEQRKARDNWLEENVKGLIFQVEGGNLHQVVGALIGVHKNFDKAEQWQGEYQKEDADQKLDRWSKENSPPSEEIIRNAFINSGKGRAFYGGKKGHAISNTFSKCDLFHSFYYEKKKEDLSQNFHIKHWPFFKRLFNITDSFRYGEEAEGLEPMYKVRLGISDIPKIRSQISRNILLELFLNFTNDGGVLQ